MKKVVGLLLMAMIVVSSSFGQKKEEKQVRKTFENYKSAILNDTGVEAAEYVDRRTIDYYTCILELSKIADSATVNNLSIMDKLMVFSVRHRVPKDLILSFDGKDFFVYAIKSGMVGKNSVSNNAIGDVEINGDFAKGQFLYLGEAVPFYWHFYKEQEKWKVDLTSIFEISIVAFDKLVEESGEEENAYLFSLLEMLTGKVVENDIWQTIE